MLFCFSLVNRSIAKETSNGSPLLITTSILMGMTVYGIGIPIITYNYDRQDYVYTLYQVTCDVICYPFIAGGTAAASYNLALLNHSPILDSEALMFTFGNALGIIDGIAFCWWTGNQKKEKSYAYSIILSSLAFSIGGYYAAAPLGITPEDSWAIFLGTLYTMGFTTAATSLFYEDTKSFPMLGQVGGGLALLASLLAPPAMYFFTRMEYYTGGDLCYLFLPVVIGGLTGSAVATLIPEADYKTYVISSMIGSAAGFAGGYFLTRGLDFSEYSGFEGVLGSLAGGALGFSIALMFDAKDTAAYTILSSLGSAAGYGLFYYLAMNEGNAPESVSSDRASFDAKSSVSFVPLGLSLIVSGLSAFFGPSVENETGTAEEQKISLKFSPEEIAYDETSGSRYFPKPFIAVKVEF